LQMPVARGPKAGPRGRVLEPYARDILLRAREGQSMRAIADWLAQPPRGVVITRQAVHQWVKARIRKLAKLNRDFEGTGVSESLQREAVVKEVFHVQPVRELPVPRPLPAQLPPSFPARNATDMSDFLVSDADLNRAQNPLLSKR
jgi:hypothetical protein